MQCKEKTQGELCFISVPTFSEWNFTQYFVKPTVQNDIMEFDTTIYEKVRQ